MPNSGNGSAFDPHMHHTTRVDIIHSLTIIMTMLFPQMPVAVKIISIGWSN